jgi:tRNA uridine 5-carboxymethylaminomethyl modification enzyme
VIGQFRSLGLVPIKKAMPLKELLRRPEVSWKTILRFEPSLKGTEPAVGEQAEIAVKYEGYITREREAIARVLREGEERIPEDFDFQAVPSLSHEVREKLNRIRPRTLGQAQRISGVTPAAASILSIYLRKYRSTTASEPFEMSGEFLNGQTGASQL